MNILHIPGGNYSFLVKLRAFTILNTFIGKRMMTHFLYFDAGLGAMLVQAAVAGAAGFLLFSKGVMYKVKSFFGMIKEDQDPYGSIDIKEEDADIDDKKG